MPVRGTLKMTELRMAQFNVDLTKGSMSITATAALVDPSTGVTAWHKCTGNIWSKDAQEALTQLIEAMEQDMARAVMASIDESSDGTAVSRPVRTTTAGGLGEHLGVDVPEM